MTALVALALVLAACDEQQDTPLGPEARTPTGPSDPTGAPVSSTDKEAML